MERVEQFRREWMDGSAFVTARTSGSTGTPKEIRLAKADMKASAEATNEFFGIGAGSVVAMALSADYIAGKMMAVRAWLSGAELLPLPVSNEVVLPSDKVVDLLAIVPSQMASLARHAEYAAQVRNVLVGGAAPSAEMCAALVRAGYRVYISYGMTETCSHVALADGSDAGRVFRAMPGVSFAATDDSRLVIRCPKFSFGELATNDVVELLSEHSFKWRGRADGVINSGGIKLYPEELEALYAPAMEDVPYYVCAAEHEQWGQAVCLVVECGEERIKDMERRLTASIADHKRLPKRYVAVDSLPRTSNGKVRRVLP
ncbi:MAG: AMP-binding protein [Muribaculaceae bacterium]|nr:AMP-binding protein [Muribaculaceae bacterium]